MDTKPKNFKKNLALPVLGDYKSPTLSKKGKTNEAGKKTN